MALLHADEAFMQSSFVCLILWDLLKFGFVVFVFLLMANLLEYDCTLCLHMDPIQGLCKSLQFAGIVSPVVFTSFARLTWSDIGKVKNQESERLCPCRFFAHGIASGGADALAQFAWFACELAHLA